MLNLRLTALIAFLILATASVAAQSAGDRYPFVKDGKVGFIDSEGREVIPVLMSEAGLEFTLEAVFTKRAQA
jgi:hypothetical protein